MGAWVWASGSQVWNGNIGTLMPKPMNMPAKISTWVESTTGCEAELAGVGDALGDARHRERLGAGDEEQREEAHDHERRAEQRVEEELDRGVLALLAAPHADHEVHRQEHDLEEDEEEDQVLRHEGAEHPGVQHEDEDEERLRVVRLGEVVPAVDDAQRRDQQREGDERQRQPVDADEVVGLDDLDPLVVDDELERAGVVVVEVGHHRDAEGGRRQARAERHDLQQLLFALGDQHHQQRACQRQEHHEAEAPVGEEVVVVHGPVLVLVP